MQTTPAQALAVSALALLLNLALPAQAAKHVHADNAEAKAAIAQDKQRLAADKAKLQADKAAGNAAAVQADKAAIAKDKQQLAADKARAHTAQPAQAAR